MVARIQIKTRVKVRGKNGGRRPGAGRRLGSVNEAKKVGRAQAARMGLLPHELLFQWAATGQMSYPSGNKKKDDTKVELEPSDRIACAKGCAAWYKASMQPRQAPGEQPPVLRLELDEKMIAALAKNQPDKLDVLRDVLRAIQAGGADMAQAAGGAPAQVDAGRYGRMLSETSEVDGRA